MAHFTWLEEKKREAAMMRQMGRQGNNGYAVTPVRYRYMGNTGNGEDGIVQPSNPTDIIDTNVGPRMLHEDENVYVGNNNELEVQPSPYTQRQLRRIEYNQNIPGYQYGTGRSRGRSIPDPGTSVAKEDAPITQTAPTFTTKTPTINPVRVAPIQTAPTFTTETPATEPIKVQASEPITRTAPTITKPETPTINPIRVAPMSQVTQVAPAITVPTTTTTPRFPEVKTPTGVTTEKQLTVSETPSLETQARTTAMGRSMAAARGELPEYDAALQKQLDDMRATQDVENLILAQQGAQGDLSPQEIAAQQAMSRAAGRQAISSAAAEGIIGKGQLQQQATQQLAGEALAGQRFEEDKARYKDTQGWTEYEAAIAAGDYDTAAAAYKSVTGNDISMEEMQRYQGYLNRSREAEVSTLENTLGQEKFNSIMDRINSGASLKSINEEFGTNLTQDEYNQMFETTEYGQLQWTRDLSAANMLLETPGAVNKTQAAQRYAELFPGTSFDFSTLIANENSEQFADGLSQLSSYVAAGLTFEDAITAMRKDGTLTMMGVTEDEAAQLYNGMKANAIDEEWNAIESSDWYQALSDEDKADMQTFFTASMKGDLDYDILNEYEVYDADGNLDRVFLDEEAANSYVASNEGYTVTDTGRKRVVARNILTGTAETTTTTGGGETETPETALAQIQKEGGENYTLSDVVAFQEDKDKLPTSKAEMDEWDAAKKDVSFWNTMDTKYIDGQLNSEGQTPKISTENVNKIIKAKNAGDARADKYFVEDNAQNMIAPEGTSFDRVLTNISGNLDITNGTSGGESDINSDILQYAKDNVGKLIEVDGKSYIVIGPTTTDYMMRINGKDMNVRNIGAIEVYDIETKKRTLLHQYLIAEKVKNVNTPEAVQLMRDIPEITDSEDIDKLYSYMKTNNRWPSNKADMRNIYNEWIQSKG